MTGHVTLCNNGLDGLFFKDAFFRLSRIPEPLPAEPQSFQAVFVSGNYEAAGLYFNWAAVSRESAVNSR